MRIGLAYWCYNVGYWLSFVIFLHENISNDRFGLNVYGCAEGTPLCETRR